MPRTLENAHSTQASRLSIPHAISIALPKPEHAMIKILVDVEAAALLKDVLRGPCLINYRTKLWKKVHTATKAVGGNDFDTPSAIQSGVRHLPYIEPQRTVLSHLGEGLHEPDGHRLVLEKQTLTVWFPLRLASGWFRFADSPDGIRLVSV
ncbi:hypothetical protein EXIGLDRAFT_807029 [Exidia glandulosa HHB12029]|uniref:Uncharacterized protein n=1 Tax=Exidia glandulosa HHB12029 TaxID=1314781 RepID=A0A165M2U8_EXIGL|nr:hypothetical protein EXIGLDRAFT_807029 [Exidia glandulosa HHB12029]